MDPNSGRLFGAIGTVEPNENTPAFLLAGADPDFSRWYTLQWLMCEGYREAADMGHAEIPAQP
jgi:hypothetical protein